MSSAVQLVNQDTPYCESVALIPYKGTTSHPCSEGMRDFWKGGGVSSFSFEFEWGFYSNSNSKKRRKKVQHIGLHAGVCVSSFGPVVKKPTPWAKGGGADPSTPHPWIHTWYYHIILW